ncbi:sulfotransferase family protein [Dyella nitratireducens]|uniref:Sulfotransferase n=1 Tax=Dyella nitratireducens TaxID=1849580 RepID=A0ABQ1GBL6_9GAMM|nr:sulfotransferase [Dyella nitratireducens]GGA40610.1 hypothetical protein GCM10010981_32270 [Dyella nitratireducens]GLQ40585.1 hypothetical protein GCM10007902_04340 [Dyella nitratireducens]
MSRAIHFISGLPRSGSTLLAALLRQNPRFHAGMSSPVAGMFNNLLGEMSGRNEFSVFIDDAQRERVLRGLFDNYYGPDIDAQVIFDTNRMWCSKLPVLRTLFPHGRIIACVRHVSWVMDSFERLTRRNVFQPSSIFSYRPGTTVYSRTEGLAGGDGLVGHAYNALKEAYFGEHAAQHLMLVQYETLTNDPARVLAAIYAFLDEPAFEHDFENISYDATEFDLRAGTPGLHAVRPRVEAICNETILPPDVFRRYENDAFWRDPNINLRRVQVV